MAEKNILKIYEELSIIKKILDNGIIVYDFTDFFKDSITVKRHRRIIRMLVCFYSSKKPINKSSFCSYLVNRSQNDLASYLAKR
jgi:hypothetical protein